MNRKLTSFAKFVPSEGANLFHFPKRHRREVLTTLTKDQNWRNIGNRHIVFKDERIIRNKFN